MFIDSGIHKVHLLRYLASEPAHLYAAALPQALVQHEGEDGVVVMTRGASGVVGVIHHAWTSAQQPSRPGSWSPGHEAASRSSLHLLAPTGAGQYRTDLAVSRRRQWADPDGPGVPGEHPDGSEPEMSGAEGLRDLAVVLKAYESIEQGVSSRCSSRRCTCGALCTSASLNWGIFTCWFWLSKGR